MGLSASSVVGLGQALQGVAEGGAVVGLLVRLVDDGSTASYLRVEGRERHDGVGAHRLLALLLPCGKVILHSQLGQGLRQLLRLEGRAVILGQIFHEGDPLAHDRASDDHRGHAAALR